MILRTENPYLGGHDAWCKLKSDICTLYNVEEILIQDRNILICIMCGRDNDTRQRHTY